MRGYNIDDYINQKFGKLTLIKNLHKVNKDNSKLALFKCDCGKEKELVFTQVLNGTVRSCGCAQGKLSKIEKEKQMKSLLKLYSTKNMKNNKTGYTRYY